MSKKAYLLLYNTAQLACWSWAVAATVIALKKGPAAVYESAAPAIRKLKFFILIVSIENLARLLLPRSLAHFSVPPLTSSCSKPLLSPLPSGLGQLSALLETLHVLLGLTKGSAPLALLQWFGRSNVLFLIVGALPQLRDSPALAPLFLAWAAADIVRYAWYAAAALSPNNEAPGPLTWARYSAFIPLYPLGVFAGEMPLIKAAIPLIREKKLFSVEMPNEYNFAFSYAAFCTLGLYVLLPAAFAHLYTHMLRARGKRLGGSGGGSGGGGERKRE